MPKQQSKKTSSFVGQQSSTSSAQAGKAAQLASPNSGSGRASISVGRMVGPELGLALGSVLGETVGIMEGPALGSPEGLLDGETLGEVLGAPLGITLTDGLVLGAEDGAKEGSSEGEDVGLRLGKDVGRELGLTEGTDEGAVEGDSEGCEEGAVLIVGDGLGDSEGAALACASKSPSSWQQLRKIPKSLGQQSPNNPAQLGCAPQAGAVESSASAPTPAGLGGPLGLAVGAWVLDFLLGAFRLIEGAEVGSELGCAVGGGAVGRLVGEALGEALGTALGSTVSKQQYKNTSSTVGQQSSASPSQAGWSEQRRDEELCKFRSSYAAPAAPAPPRIVLAARADAIKDAARAATTKRARLVALMVQNYVQYCVLLFLKNQKSAKDEKAVRLGRWGYCDKQIMDDSAGVLMSSYVSHRPSQGAKKRRPRFGKLVNRVPNSPDHCKGETDTSSFEVEEWDGQFVFGTNGGEMVDVDQKTNSEELKASGPSGSGSVEQGGVCRVLVVVEKAFGEDVRDVEWAVAHVEGGFGCLGLGSDVVAGFMSEKRMMSLAPLSMPSVSNSLMKTEQMCCRWSQCPCMMTFQNMTSSFCTDNLEAIGLWLRDTSASRQGKRLTRTTKQKVPLRFPSLCGLKVLAASVGLLWIQPLQNDVLLTRPCHMVGIY